MTGNILYGGDLNDQFYFWKTFLVENIKSGTIPFWNPYSFSGTPFLAHPSTAAFYPLNLIFFLLPLNLTFSAFILIHIVLGGIFMYWLARKYTDKLAALSASFIFSLSGMMAARIYSGHVDIISTLIWIPAVFGSVISALKEPSRKKITISIIFLTLQILAGYQAVVIFTLELILIYQAVLAIFDWKKVVQKFITFISIIIISFGISAIQLLPTIEFVRHSIRGAGLPYESLTWGSYTLEQFLMFINPFRYGNPFPQNYTYNGPGPNFFEISYFVGIVPILLFFTFILYKLYELFKYKKIDKLYVGLLTSLGFFILVSLGNNFPLHLLLYKLIPFYRLFRFPSQHLIMAVFIVSLISALSVSKIKNNLIKIAILCLIIFELVTYDKRFIRFTSVPTQNFDTKLIETIREEKDLVRILPDYSVVSAVRKSWDFESSSYYKIHSTSGYNPILLNNYYRFIDMVNKNYTSSIRQYNVEIPPPDPASKDIDFLNVKYVLTDKNYDAIYDKSLSKYTLKLDGTNYRLYENMDYLPRFFLDCSGKVQKNVEVTDYQINNIKLKTNSPCDGILSSSEVYYPGWQAKIDNIETPVNRNNTAFRSIFLPKGEHEVVFYYQPTIYYIGGLITLLSLIVGFVVTRKYY